MKKFILIALVVGAAVAIAKKKSADRAEWHGLSEDQVREKLGDRLPGKMPDEAKARVLGLLAEARVPAQLVRRIEARMGG